MDLASGYSDSTDYGNGYTPLATNAINNNNANYWANQATVALMAQQAQDNVFASGGGFGKQTADYAGAGAAYGRAVQPQMSDNIYGVNGDTWSGMSAGDRATFNKTMGSSSSQPFRLTMPPPAQTRACSILALTLPTTPTWRTAAAIQVRRR